MWLLTPSPGGFLDADAHDLDAEHEALWIEHLALAELRLRGRPRIVRRVSSKVNVR
jgi:hypothetical protein